MAQAAGSRVIGVGGIYGSGIMGVLRRNGIPAEYILESELESSAALSRYGMVLVSMVQPSRLWQAAPAFDEYVSAGGVVCIDGLYSWRPIMTRWRRSSGLARALSYVHRGRSSQAWLKWPGREGAPAATYGPFMTTASITLPQGGSVLARYARVRDAYKRWQPRIVSGPIRPGDPAVIRSPYGGGAYILAAPRLSMGFTLGQSSDWDLVLALVRSGVGNRIKPQLEDEGVALRRRESPRSLRLEEEQPTDERQGAEQDVQASRLPDGVEELSDGADSEYNLTGILAEGSQVLIDWRNAEDFLRLRREADMVLLEEVIGAQTRSLTESAWPTGQPAHLVIKRRVASLALFVGGGTAHRLHRPANGGRVGVRGDADAWRFQPVEPIHFADDFMRGEDEESPWELERGFWHLSETLNPDLGANPFALEVLNVEEFLTTAGYPFWDDYTLSTAVRPDDERGTVGLVAYYRDADDYLAFQASITGTTPASDGFRLVRRYGERTFTLAQASGGLSSGQWFRLSLSVDGGRISASVDGVSVLEAEDETLIGGRVGLWTDGAGAHFDDVVVRPSRGDDSDGRELLGGSLASYAGVIDQDTWAGPAMEWRADPDIPGLFWNRGYFPGDVGVQMRLSALAQPGAAVELRAKSAPHEPHSGWRVTAMRKAGGLQLELLSGSRLVRRITAPWSDESAPRLALEARGDDVLVGIDGRVLIRHRRRLPSRHGASIAFGVHGALGRVSDIAYWSPTMVRETFAKAPVNWWISSGLWDVTNRWSCTPDWSWFGGMSPRDEHGRPHGEAAIWFKRRLVGDHVLDVYMGPKMITIPGTRRGFEMMRQFNLALCGDGHDVETGYSFVLGAEAGGLGARLYRHGELVDADPRYRLPSRSHNRWLHLTAVRQGNQVELWFDERRVLSYADPRPLTDGYAAIWTQDNGIVVPQVTLYANRLDDPVLPLTRSGQGAKPVAAKQGNPTWTAVQ